MSQDFITQLRALQSPTTRMAKRLDADGEWHEYGNARHFSPQTVPLSGLDDLYDTLCAMSIDPWLCAIRGEKRSTVTPTATPDLFHHSRPGVMQRNLRVYKDAAHHWVMIDLDHFEASVPFTEDPEAAIQEAVEALLPVDFHEADYIWQASNSAGFKPGVRAHLWFWLERPMRSAELKLWAAHCAPGVDRAPFNPVQAHYTADPVLESGDDPFQGRRMGMVRGMIGGPVSLRVPSDLQEQSELVDTDNTGEASAPDPREKQNFIGAFCRTYSIRDLVEGRLADVFAYQNDSSNRLNFLLSEGGAAGGAFITADGLHIVNKHNSDPFFNRAVNAFDLVRHYAHNGEHDDPDRPHHQSASYRALIEECREDAAVVANSVDVPDALSAEDEFSAVEEDIQESHDRVNRLIDRQRDFMREVESSETHRNARAFDLWQAEKVPEDVSSRFEFDQHGNVKANLRNMQIVWAVDPWLRRSIGYDQFAQRRGVYGPLPWRGSDITTIRPSEWRDDDDSKLTAYLSDAYGFEPSERVLTQASDVAAGWAQFHPVRSWIKSLEWDGVARLDTWLQDHLGVADSAYTRAVGARTLIGAVRRVFEPGCKFDTMLVIEGRQGLGKSSAIRALCGVDTWYREGVPDLSDEKKLIESIQGKWLIELPELTALRRSGVDESKEVVTRSSDAARLAYGRSTTTMPRQSIFIGTTNNTDYLRDATGNRRFWPVTANRQVDVSALEAARGQIMAEAYQRMLAGERCWIGADEPALAAEAQQQQDSRYTESPQEEMIREWLDTPLDRDPTDFEAEDGDKLRQYVSVTEVMQQALGVSPNAPDSVTASARAAIRRFFRHDPGWSDGTHQKWVDGKNQRVYCREGPDSEKPLH